MHMVTKCLQKVEGSQLVFTSAFSCLCFCICFWTVALVFFILCFSMSPRATMRALSFLSFPDAVCFAYKTSLTGMISSSLRGVLPSMKVSWSIKFLISILIACNQALWTSSSSFRTALKKCGSGRYLFTGLSLEDEAVALMVSMAV